jgi:hypothetical protein
MYGSGGGPGVSSVPPRRRRPVPRDDPGAPRRSNAAIPVALVVVGVGIYFARFSLIVPALFGLLLLYAGASFLSTRVNPLSSHFYLTTKPSWTSVLVVFVGSLALFGTTYALYLDHVAPLLPRI